MKKIDIKNLYYWIMIKLLRKHNIIQSLGGYDIEHCNLYVKWIKFGELYQDIANNKVDKTLNKYMFDFVDIRHFKKVNTCEKYIKTLIKKYLRTL